MRRSGLVSTLIEVLLPSLCVACEGPLPATDRGLCGPCWSAVIPLQGCRCELCGGMTDEPGEPCLECSEAPPRQAATVVWGEHAGVLRTALLALKYSGRDELSKPLARRLSARLAQLPWIGDVDRVVAVPSHELHRLRRGWPAAELLAVAVAREIGRPFCRLVGRRGLRRQAGRSRVQRQILAADRFPVKRPASGRLLVIDDVLTTGATLRQVAGNLLHAGAETVYCAALAMAPVARRMT